MDPIITNALMTFGAGFAGAAFAKAKGPGQVLDDIMTLVGFEKLHEVAEKKRAKREQNVKQFKESIAQNIVSIPEENIVEPPLSIVGPALEASKYYIEEETLREMFAKIIGLSMNSEYTGKLHPSFVEIIKQLSLHDAQVLQKIKKVGLITGSPYPIVKMSVKYKEGSKTLFPLIVLFNGDIGYFEDNTISINNLERLGILQVDMNSQVTNSDKYKKYYDNSIIQELLKQHSNMELDKGCFYLSNFGENFISLCVE